MKVAITGATGFVGTHLVKHLHGQGKQVVVLTRDAARAQKIFPASVFPNLEIVEAQLQSPGEWQNAIALCDGVVNLAGESIAEGRWTPARKQEILDSRKVTTENLVNGIVNSRSADANSAKPQVLVNASAIGFYGTSETATFDENSTSGTDFLAQVCQAWEAEAKKVEAVGVRLVILRFGIVLGDGGALAKMVTPFKLFAGGPLGTGQQWFSWVHIDDVVSLITQALENGNMAGVYNATAPNPVTMNELCDNLGQVLNRPSWLPVPALALEALLGDGAMVVLEGQRVLPTRTLQSGFNYKFQNIQPALKDILV